MPKMVAIRDSFGQALVELGRENSEIVVLDADVSSSTKTALFGKAFPDRFFNFGIAEANMMDAAAGFATAGKIPFASTKSRGAVEKFDCLSEAECEDLRSIRGAFRFLRWGLTPKCL